MRVTTLDEIGNLTLDTIVNTNRDRCQIRLSCDDELAALRPIPDTDKQRSIKAVIEDWRFVAVCETGGEAVHLLSGINCDKRCEWLTSPVTWIDLDAGLVATHSGSLYRLRNRGEGEPGLDILLLICDRLNCCGLGRMLGVPAVFY